MQCSDLSSTISGILILQYVLEMRNATSLGKPLKQHTVALALSVIPTCACHDSGSCRVKPSVQKYRTAGQWRSRLLVLNLI